MSDREKMLALVAEWRREAGQLRMLRDVAADRNAERIEKCAADLEALLTEPTLEEAKAFCDGYLYRKSVEHRNTTTDAALVEEMAVGFKLFNDGATPTFLVSEAVIECLRRVKE